MCERGEIVPSSCQSVLSVISVCVCRDSYIITMQKASQVHESQTHTHAHTCRLLTLSLRTGSEALQSSTCSRFIRIRTNCSVTYYRFDLTKTMCLTARDVFTKLNSVCNDLFQFLYLNAGYRPTSPLVHSSCSWFLRRKKMFTIKQACWMCKNRDPPTSDGMQFISEFQNKKPDPQ